MKLLKKISLIFLSMIASLFFSAPVFAASIFDNSSTPVYDFVSGDTIYHPGNWYSANDNIVKLSIPVKNIGASACHLVWDSRLYYGAGLYKSATVTEDIQAGETLSITYEYPSSPTVLPSSVTTWSKYTSRTGDTCGAFAVAGRISTIDETDTLYYTSTTNRVAAAIVNGGDYPITPEWASQTSWYSTSAVPASGGTWNPASSASMVVVPAEEPDGTQPISYDDWTASSPHLPLSVIYQIAPAISGACTGDLQWETQQIASVSVVVRGQGIDDDLMFTFYPNMSVFVDGTDYCIRSSVLNGTHTGTVNYGYASKFTVDFDAVMADLGGSLVWEDTAGGEDTASIATSPELSSFCDGKSVSWYIDPVCYFMQFLDWLISPTAWTTYWFEHFGSFASNRLPFGWAIAPVREFNDSIANYDCDLPVLDASTLTASTPTVVSFDWQFDFCEFWAGLEQYFSNEYIQFSLKMIIGIAGIAAMVGFARMFF